MSVTERSNPGSYPQRPGLVASDAGNTFFEIAPLPPPDAGLGCLCAPHDLVGGATILCCQHDLGPPDTPSGVSYGWRTAPPAGRGRRGHDGGRCHHVLFPDNDTPHRRSKPSVRWGTPGWAFGSASCRRRGNAWIQSVRSGLDHWSAPSRHPLDVSQVAVEKSDRMTPVVSCAFRPTL